MSVTFRNPLRKLSTASENEDADTATSVRTLLISLSTYGKEDGEQQTYGENTYIESLDGKSENKRGKLTESWGNNEFLSPSLAALGNIQQNTHLTFFFAHWYIHEGGGVGKIRRGSRSWVQKKRKTRTKNVVRCMD